MEFLRTKWRICTFCFTLFSLTGITYADIQRSEYDSTHVRVWTGWYNTDKPRSGGKDDETVTSIRKRGYEVCDGNSPIDAICRKTSESSHVFNSDTLHFVDEILAVPCTTHGLLCRDVDQQNETCDDYEIRFECLSARDVPAPENLGIIGVAAGLSVIVPILCVAIMHVVRLMKDRRHGSRQSLVGNSEISVQTDGSDLPPSYSVLFGETPADAGTTVTNGTISLTDSSGDINLPVTNLSSSNLLNVVDTNTTESVPVQSQGDATPDNTQASSESELSNSWRSRFPNMHLSIFDLFSSQGQRSGPSSPDLSYIQTPPPTYKDAIIILGGHAYNVNEDGEIGDKI